mmetsp:Transcript_39260/g.117337  ORF Transcript_39260/g.117337 Transcript_39260/m.117337 type:complete len:246 (+) Transcript_39260:86-823(+)
MAAEPPLSGGEGSAPRSSAHKVLLEFAAASQAAASQSAGAGAEAGSSPSAGAAVEAGAVPHTPAVTEELEGIIRDVAQTGSVNGYPWDSLRWLLARKVEHVLGEFWRDVPDVSVQEGESFERTVVEPLTRSLLEPRREGAPFTAQRLCELLTEPRLLYKSTRKYLYALQRAVLVTMTEEALLQMPLGSTAPVAALAVPDVDATPAGQAAPAGAADAPAGDAAAAGTSAGRKRKLPQELANGVVCE